jgi:hypothetical protein
MKFLVDAHLPPGLGTGAAGDLKLVTNRSRAKGKTIANQGLT